MTHPVAENVDPMTLTVMTASDGAVIVARGGDRDIASAPAVRERLLSLLGGALRLAALRPEADVAAATASRLRRLSPAVPRPATG